MPGWSEVELDVFGNGEEYGVHLRRRTPCRGHGSPIAKSSRPTGVADGSNSVRPLVRYRTDVLIDTRRLRRIGVVAIGGRAFSADLARGGLRLTTLRRLAKKPSL